MIGRYLTHPQVVIDPLTPIAQWGLNEIGAARVTRLIASDALAGTTQVISSAEQKALETAEPIASALGATLQIREATHENGRTATGYLPGPEFEQTADAFFANPDRSIRGWEFARDAQTRIVAELDAVLGTHKTGDLLVVGHGGVGTLLYCHLAGLEISRSHDQIKGSGGGCYFTFDLHTRTPSHHWRLMEDMTA